MPFESDKQRKYLWANKPEVAKQIAYKQDGGTIPDTWWNRRMAGTPQFRGFIDDKDNDYETIDNIDQYDKRFRKKVGDLDPDNSPGYYDTPIFYEPKYRMTDTTPQRMTNEEIAEKAKQYNFKFNEGGDVPMMDDRKPSKVIKKDRYGNSITMEYQPEVKPLDPTVLAKVAMEQGVDGIDIGMPTDEGHPGEPRGTDTVPAWLTPGEFVVNAEAAEMYGPQIEAMNNHGRAIQQAQGGPIPRYEADGGSVSDFLKMWTHIDEKPKQQPQQKSPVGDYPLVVPNEDKGFSINPIDLLKLGIGFNQGGQVPFIAGPRLNEPVYQDDGGWVTDELLDKLAEVESGGNNEAVSPVGALGMYQWMPKSAAKAGYGVEPFDPKDPKAARAATKKYLTNMQKHHGFTPEETLRAYNWGPGNVIKHKRGERKDIPDEALNYPGKILGIENTEGVTPQGDDILQAMPTARPTRPTNMTESAVGKPPKEEMAGWKSFLNQYVLGDRAQFKADGGNIVPALTDVPAGHHMFGGNQNLGGEVTNDPLEEEVIADNEYEPSFLDKYILGPKTKDERALTEEDKDFIDKQTAENEMLASADLAEEENMIAEEAKAANDIESVENDILKEKNIKDKETKATQVDDFSNMPQLEKDAGKNKITKDIVLDADKNRTEGDTKVDSAGEGGVEAAGIKADNSIKSQAFGALKEAFGDLFDKKELARMAIMYAGSRVLGGSHQGSLKWAAGNYIKRVDAKATAKDKFATDNVGKFTTQSLEDYKKTGDLTSLIPIGATQERTGDVQTFFNGKNVTRAEKVKVGKQTMWVDLKTGKPINQMQWIQDKSRVPGSTEYNSRVASEGKEYAGILDVFRKENKSGSGDKTFYATNMNPVVGGKQIASWAIKNNVKAEDMNNLITAAYEDMKAHKIANPKENVSDITPYLNARYVSSMTGNSALFTTESGKLMATEKINELGNKAAAALKTKYPNKFPGAVSNSTLTTQVYGKLRDSWEKMDEKARAPYMKGVLDNETPFYNYANDMITKFTFE